MKTKKYLFGVIFTTIAVSSFAQLNSVNSINFYGFDNQHSVTLIGSNYTIENSKFAKMEFDVLPSGDEVLVTSNLPKVSWENSRTNLNISSSQIGNDIYKMSSKNYVTKSVFMKEKDNLSFQKIPTKNISATKDNFFEKNRRNIYSSLWAFTSLNYLYCDLVGFMDKDLHSQYHSGVVDGTKITPQFLTGAAVMMQISLANVFLPQVIKNDKTLRWVQIASGLTMTLIQSATLFVGESTSYYKTFSAFEIGTTTFITINAFKWKTNSSKRITTDNF